MATGLLSYPKRPTELGAVTTGVRTMVQSMLASPRAQSTSLRREQRRAAAQPHGQQQCKPGLGGTRIFSASPLAKKAPSRDFGDPSSFHLCTDAPGRAGFPQESAVLH